MAPKMLSRPGSPRANGVVAALAGVTYGSTITTTGNREGVSPTPEVQDLMVSKAGASGVTRIHNPVANYPVCN
jgi:hypothetical protein